jgi:hypothetical protein
MSTLIKNISNLPCDLKRHIFTTFIVPQQCHIFLDWLENNSHIDMTSRVFTNEINDIIIELLSTNYYMDYLFEKNAVIKKMYIKHYIKKEKMFVLMTTRKSFVTSILMYMWH